jgi:hypothetical protein
LAPLGGKRVQGLESGSKRKPLSSLVGDSKSGFSVQKS